MPMVNLTLEQLLEGLQPLSPEELKYLQEEVRQRLGGEPDEDAQRALVAAAVEATDWWNDEGDKKWDQWQP